MEKLTLVSPSATAIWTALGLTEDQKANVIDKVTRAVNANTEESTAEVIVAVWNSLETPAEVAFGLYILRHMEAEVMVHGLFKLPEAVS